MKRILPVIASLLILLTFSFNCNANLVVQPIELSITMQDLFINGNTSKKITVLNNYNEDFNATWYIEHPNPPSYLRPNKTYIPSLSWVDVEPAWIVIPPGETRDFYIHLNIPENDETANAHWETWITFVGGGETIKREYAIRVYIDTPTSASISDDGVFSIVIGDNFVVPVQDVALVVGILITILAIGTIVVKKRKS